MFKQANLLFAYGALLDAWTQHEICGHDLGHGSMAILRGWTLDRRLTLKRPLSGLVPDESERVYGMVFEVSSADLEKLDEWERETHVRGVVRPDGFGECQAYVLRDDLVDVVPLLGTGVSAI